MNSGIGVYPDISDDKFYEKINNKKEFNDNKIDNKLKNIYCLEPQQRFISNYINPLTQYNSILIYHSVGVGKTLSAISIAENFKKTYKIMVLIKNKSLELNFTNQLLHVCSNYNNEQLLDAKKDINKHYTFITYKMLYNSVIGQEEGIFNKNKVVKGNKITNINNTVLIIDEVHNIINNNLYNAVKKLIDNSKNIKVILLSATPIYDTVYEIFEICNLLGSNLPIRQKAIDAGLVDKINVKNNKNNLLNINDEINKLTKKGEDVLKKELKGKVSYLISDSKTFANRIYNGIKIASTSNIKIITCPMSKLQEESYIYTLVNNEHNYLYNISSKQSVIVYPDNTTGIIGFKKHKNNLSLFKYKNIGLYSCKYKVLLDNLLKTDGCTFIYSNFVENNGTILIKKILSANDYKYYTEGNNDKNNGKSFVVFDHNTTSLKIFKYLKIFNSYENRNGDIIKIIVGSPVVSEGLSFKNIQNIHIMEPTWNMSKIEQIIGRGIRYNSHIFLPKNKQKVNIFLYAAIYNGDKNNSIDYLKYKLSYLKDKSIKQVEMILKKIAVDCNLNKSRNKYSEDYDFTRECGYDKCDYTCQDLTTYNEKIDASTYNINIHTKNLYTYIENKIKDLYKIGYIYDIKYIIKYINSFGVVIDNENIYYVLNDIIENETILLNNLNKKCIVIYISGFYLLNPINNKIREDYIYKIYDKIIENKNLNDLDALNKSIQKQKPIQSLKKIDIDKLKYPIYGSYKDKLGVNTGKFYIIDTRQLNKNTLDKRKNISNKVCMSHSKEELHEIVTILDKSYNNKKLSKDKYCQIIEKILVDKKYII